MKKAMKKAKYNSTLMSPTGDIGTYNEGELHRAFPKSLKASGGPLRAARALPYHAPEMQGDTGGLSVREKPKDQVC